MLIARAWLAPAGTTLRPVSEASLRREVGFIAPPYRRWIEAAPFVVLATSVPEGLDASPRGEPAGFVVVEDAHSLLLLPRRRGNNRIDSLRNILADGRWGCCS